MSTSATLRVVRGVYVAGVRHVPGDVLTLTDGDVISALLSGGRVEPADAATAARVRHSAVVSWTKGMPRELPEERNPWRKLA